MSPSGHLADMLARFSENEETVRRLVATDESFDALCHQYRHVIDLLIGYEAEAGHETKIEGLEQRRAGLEEDLLTRGRRSGGSVRWDRRSLPVWNR